MRCISPLRLVHNGRRNDVPCGQCNFCLANKRADWSFRLQQELRVSTSAVFLTLTYSDDWLPYDDMVNFRRPTLCKRHCTLFVKRLRKANEKVSSIPVRYYMVGEYGTRFGRPHYHAIVFGLHSSVLADVDGLWSYGNVKIGSCTPASIHYTTKYCINRPGKWKGVEKPFAFMSTKPGLGASYVGSHGAWHRNTEDVTTMRYYAQVNGFKTRLPRYYKDRIFTSVEREVMAQLAVPVQDAQYAKEIDRLSRLHKVPEGYYDERERYAHDQVKDKCNALNTF